MMGKERVTMMVCDNPTCGSRFEHSKDEPAFGYHIGKGHWVMAGGGPIPATYACSAACITPAIESNIEGTY